MILYERIFANFQYGKPFWDWYIANNAGLVTAVKIQFVIIIVLTAWSPFKTCNIYVIGG